MPHPSNRIDSPPVRYVQSLIPLMRSVVSLVRQKMRQRRRRIAVQHLDEHLLKDAGLDPEDVGGPTGRIQPPPVPWHF